MLVDAYNQSIAAKDTKLRKSKKSAATESTIEGEETTKLHKPEGNNRYKYCCYSN